jgi:hypothetical protein|tara:strand:- start:98 stop:277 length:180 start_codon:yes stop_codon:yes gene_type:complete
MTKEYKEFKEWMDDGNVEQLGDNVYVEQTTQWKKKFTLVELVAFYIKEYRSMENYRISL